MTHHLQHGSILGGLSTTPNLQLAIDDYRDILGMNLVYEGILSDELAQSWNCPNSAGRPIAIFQPKSGAQFFMRVVEQEDVPHFAPTTSYGWAAFELSVQDVFGWPDRLQGSGFEIVGPPKELAGLPYFIPMQILGRGREMLYLNEVRENTPSTDLPMARSLVDHAFICILAAQYRGKAVSWYEQHFGFNDGGTYTLEYSMINNAFNLPSDSITQLTMVQKDRLPILEVDDYPEMADIRPRHSGMLPPGNAVVSLAVDELDSLNLSWISLPKIRDEAPYLGRKSASVIGPAGEILELIEI
ncbi:hypothetical protein LPB140_00985 [Sphingorhabdus lutea]|uniref:VOC family protein n=1 Tax=Sphingorhabdus lutea TaxID=1913578 RepID=A0A1L3J946_9SPHN|nr:hypothetical protein [Sphingorhabdus lutea]APG61647.1 hypothetical protein LPB140_00985 [Sphingorhabdus lutea]